MNNPITYSKEIKKSYDVLRFEINNIPVLEKEKLSIYQKYIILILNNGVVARNQNALIDILSTILNIKKSFVKDFVETLVELKYLIHNDKTNNYQLSDSYKIMMDQKDGTIMKANTIKRYAEFKDLYYIEKFNKIVGREYFENNNITLTRKSRKINKNVYDILNQKTSEQNTVNHIQNILKEFFDKDDITLSNDFKYTLTDNFDTYQMDLDVVLFYEYNNEISNLQNIQYNTSLDISNEILKDIKEEYNVDKKIPRFIELKEKFYDALEKNDKELIDIENRYTQKNNDKKNIESFINLYEAKIKELKTIQPDKINQNIEIIENLNNNVQSKKPELNNINNELETIKKEKAEKIQEIEQIIESGTDNVHPLISKVMKKYKTRINGYVTIICSRLDEALSASECNNYEEIEKALLQVRDINNQTIKKVLDCIFQTKSRIVNDYFNKKYEKLFEERNIDLETFNYMEKFHDINNPYGHIEDANILYNNEESIKNFIKLDKKEREKILLSTVKFFDKIKLSEEEMKKIEQKRNIYNQ